MDTSKCPKCGCSLTRLRHQFRLDCEYCYTWFHADLVNLFPSASKGYKGVPPAWIRAWQPNRNELQSLQNSLAEALEQENYEQAQIIRNRIESLKDQSHES